MITAIILAGGASRRMGRSKQLLCLDDEPALRWVARAALESEAEEVLVVTGCASAAVAAAVGGLPVRLVHNAEWEEGQAASVRAGVAAVSPRTEAVLFMQADQPLVSPALINALLAAYRTCRAAIVAPVCRGRRGTPVLFDLSRWRGELTGLSGDEGARRIIAAHQEEVYPVAVEDMELFLDMDTPEEYQQLCILWRKRRCMEEGGEEDA